MRLTGRNDHLIKIAGLKPIHVFDPKATLSRLITMNAPRYIYISFCLIHGIVACVALIFHSAQNSSIETEESGMGKKSKKTTMPTAPPAAGLAVADPTGKNKGDRKSVV